MIDPPIKRFIKRRKKLAAPQRCGVARGHKKADKTRLESYLRIKASDIQ